MRRADPRRVRALAALVVVSALALSLAGAGAPKKKRAEPPPPKVEETVADLAYIQQHGEIKLEGVGLVVGLDDTGVDPPPSYYREKLVDEMRKAGVENANKLLEDPRVSMVIVRMTDPAGRQPGRPARRRARAPPGVRHHEPGRRLPARVPAPRGHDRAAARPRKGSDVGRRAGAGHDRHAQAEPDDPKVGRVLGGGRVKKDDPVPARHQGEPQERPDLATCSRRWSTSGSTRPRGSNRRARPTPRPTSTSS